MKRRIAAALALTLAGATVLGACGSQTTATGTASVSQTSASGQEAQSAEATSAKAETEDDAPEPAASTPAEPKEVQLGEDGKARVIITTDLEVDDENSIIHQCLFFNDIDLEGIVVTASQFHFIGDGEHTVDEINPYCRADKGLTELRPMDLNFLPDFWTNQYAEAYPTLSENAEGYPTPEELVELTKIGNVEFEGDVREDTEGSDLIKNAMLDDDDRTLYIFQWGGFNTVARALLSIYEDYYGTDDWDAIYKKVTDKVVISGAGQDRTYKYYIADKWPDLTMFHGTAGYAAYSAATNIQEDARYTFQADWLKENIKFDHGSLNEYYRLVNDGQYYEGESEEFQFGQTNTVMNKEYNDYDFIAEGDSSGIIGVYPTGLRTFENGIFGSYAGRHAYAREDQSDAGYPTSFEGGSTAAPYYNEETGEPIEDRYNPYLLDFQMEWAARADWCVKGYDECNHAPVVSAESGDVKAAAGETVEITVAVEDPDGNGHSDKWFVDQGASVYSGTETDFKALIESSEASQDTIRFTVPADAKTGDIFLVQVNVTDDADAPMTRYAQYLVTVQ